MIIFLHKYKTIKTNTNRKQNVQIEIELIYSSKL